MTSNLDRYQKDLKRLVSEGDVLSLAIDFECHPEKYNNLKEKHKKLIQEIPSFREKYQHWYSESLAVIKLLLSDRINDFIKLYEKPKTRKTIECSSYVIEDYLQGLSVNRGMEKIVGPDAAIPQFQQQLNILKSAEKRFASSLFDIKQLVQADLFDSELGAAKELNKKGFVRAAGAVAGVVLEKHLAQVCNNHKIIMSKKNPSINDYNQSLKDNDVTEIKDWRFIQCLADLRNLCDHDKKKEPTKDNISELITGVDKTLKTLF